MTVSTETQPGGSLEPVGSATGSEVGKIINPCQKCKGWGVIWHRDAKAPSALCVMLKTSICQLCHGNGMQPNESMKTKQSNKQGGTPAVHSSDWLGEFKPSLCNVSGNTWEASIRLPIVGDVTTAGNGWEEAKMRLWLVSEAVKMLAKKPCKHPKDWTESEWRATLKIMGDVMPPNEKVSGGNEPR